MYLPRSIEPLIKKDIFKGKTIIVYGARRTGKTTLVKKIADDLKVKYGYFNCDQIDVISRFQNAGTSTELKKIVGDDRLIIIDEAQRVKNIGLKLKLLVDNFPDQQIIATGSSSFDLANEINEPLTGRNFEYWLYPFTLKELVFDLSFLEIDRRLPDFLIYGSYPEVCQVAASKEKEKRLKQLASNYLYKDILTFERMKNSETVLKLLQALALQIGSEVSYNELAGLVGVAKETVAGYIEILEKSFIVFRLLPYSYNQRKAISKLRKVYFFDLGIRNAIVNSFNPLELRDDVGKLWENFVIAERFKAQAGPGYKTNYYFWRTYNKQEVDLVEMEGGKMHGWEIKWGRKEKKAPKGWREGVKNQTFQVINRDNYKDRLL